MKNLLLLFCAICIISPAVFSQAQTKPSDVFQMGDRKVTVPAPDGFVDISSQFTSVTARMRATEDPGNDLLALHVPTTFVPKLKISEDIDLDFYAKVSVNRQVRPSDISPEINAIIVADLEKNFGTYLDPNGTLMKGVETNSRKGLTELLGSETSVNINSTKSLGFFEKTDKVFSGMMLMSFEIYGRKMTTLATVSLVFVNRRVVFVNVFKMAPTKNDVRAISDFARKWTAKIIEANK